MPLFLMGCFPVDFQEVKRPLRTKSVKRPIKVGKRPINEGKRPIKAKVLVGVSVGCLMGCFRAPPPWRKTAPLERPIKRSMRKDASRLLTVEVVLLAVWLFWLTVATAPAPLQAQAKNREKLQNCHPLPHSQTYGKITEKLPKNYKITLRLPFFVFFR